MNKEKLEKNKFNKTYFKSFSNYPKAILKGKKPLHYRFWINYIKKHKKYGRLLDLGCGVGLFLQCAEKYYETYGVDISNYAINKARENTKKSNLLLATVTDLVFKNIKFDIITSFDVFEHLKNPRIAIQECNKILKKGGLFIITIPNINSLGRKWKKKDWHGYRDKTHVSLFSNEEWIKLFRNNGFEIIDIFYDGLWDSPYFSNIPNFIQHLFFKIPFTLLSYCLGVRFPEKWGENTSIVAIKLEEISSNN